MRKTATEYRIEVSIQHLSFAQQEQFIAAARLAGFSVIAIHNGLTLAVVGLKARQATTLRDGLLQAGIHSSIGLS